jgi:hypothetical protein
MKIANIVHEGDLVTHEKVDFINYYRGSVQDVVIDNPELPTLYVGWNNLKGFAKDNDKLKDINILKHQIDTNKLYWEFSFDENKQSHVKGVADFVYYCPNFYFMDRYGYINLDPVFFNIKDNRDLLDVLPKKMDAFFALKDRMIYILSDDKIYGLDMEMYRFFKFNIDGIMKFLSEKTRGQQTIDLSGEYYESQYKRFPDFTQLKRYLVVLITKQNKE